MADPGSRAIGLTVSLAPITRVTSVSLKSSLISSISRTTKCDTLNQLIGKALFKTKRTIVWHGGFRQKNVALSGHTTSNRMDSKLGTSFSP